LSQSFTPLTVAATTSFIFTASDPGGAGDRSMNVTFRDSASTAGGNQINLRLVDLDADGDGDVQIFNGTWQTVLPNAVTFGAPTSFSLTINSYGAGATYDLNVGGNVANGLSFFQSGVLSNFAQVAFVNAQQAAGSTFKVDNVSVVAASTGEPFVVTISPNGANYDFTWTSQAGKTYDLVSSTDLSTSPTTWAVWDGRTGITGTAASNTITSVPGGGPRRFFAVIEN